MRALPTSLAVLALSLVAVPAAAASTVRLEVGGGEDPSTMTYTAAAGEANAVTIAVDGGKATIEDTGATIEAQQGCKSVDAHHATCDLQSSTDSIQETDAKLLDGNDSFRISGGSAFVDGGPGDDKLTGGESFDNLQGGGGTDELHGGAGGDTLDDGDTTGDANADVLDGGADDDSVTYASRTTPVTVDLASAAPAGEAGEGDTLTDVESVTGGKAGDTLSGNDRDNFLTGGDGNDTLDGRGGADFLIGGIGDDLLIGGPGADQLDDGPGDDTLRLDNPPGTRDRAIGCESGDDLIVGLGPSPSVGLTCERADFGFGFAMSLIPKKLTKKYVRYLIPCPESYRDASGVCHGALVVEPRGAYNKSKKWRRNHRFARKAFAVEGGNHAITARLNRAGRRELRKRFYRLQLTVVLKETASGTTRRFTWTGALSREYLRSIQGH